MDQKKAGIKAIVRLHHYRFPTKTVPISGDFAVVVLSVLKIESGEIPNDMYQDIGKHTIVVSGKMPKLDNELQYEVEAVLEKDNKYGLQYKCKTIGTAYNLKDPRDQKTFLGYFLTENQINALFANYDNPIDLLANRDIAALKKIKGIGPSTAERLCNKYADNVTNSKAYVELSGLGITKNAIDSIVNQIGSIDIAIGMIHDNPYALIQLVRGYSWAKADEIALRKGYTTDCRERCVAYAKFRLEQDADLNGDSRVSIDGFFNDIATVCSPVTKENLSAYIKNETVDEQGFADIVEKLSKNEKIGKKPLFFYSKEEQKIGLYSLRYSEYKISNELKRIKEAPSSFHYDRKVCERIIREVEKEQGFPFSPEQIKAIWSILDNNISILTGSAGCVDCDTEFFDGTKWKKISEYKQGDQVLIYEANGLAHLEKPERYIKLPCDEMTHLYSHSMDQCVSDDHLMLYKNSNGNLHTQVASEFIPRLKNLTADTPLSTPCAFTIVNDTHMPLTDVEIKIMLAVIAEGKFISDSGTKCVLNIKGDRKKVELRKLFEEAQIQWTEKQDEKNGDSIFYIHAPIRTKVFTEEWYQCSHSQLQLICDHVLQWGKTMSKNGSQMFYTSERQNADFMQYAFASCGERARIYTHDRVGRKKSTNGESYFYKKIEYRVDIAKTDSVWFPSNSYKNTGIGRVKTTDGFKYCFTVSTGMWVSRRNNKITVLHNCGKSTTVKPLAKIFEHYGLSVAQCALSGRAASLLTEYTGLEGKTIHRTLAYRPGVGAFEYNSKNFMPDDVIIVDETSMVGEELFLSLIQAIKSGAKLIMLGDVKQLPPISVGNILADCIASGYIQTSSLSVIHRQALRSGIISEAVTVCSGRCLVKNSFLGEEIRGELKDFKISCGSDPTYVHSAAINEFKRLMAKGISSDDIQIVVPIRSKGVNSCRTFNAELQMLVNGDPDLKQVTVKTYENGTKFEIIYKPGDKIMVTKNNYHARDVYGQEVAIFNGNMGHIIDINKGSMIISLDEQGEIVLPYESWGNIMHAWACTCHRLQGSQAPYVIVCLDMGAYALLMREWLYTALTRAKKYCALVAQPEAINTACRHSNIKTKQTWLRGDLHALFLKEHA